MQVGANKGSRGKDTPDETNMRRWSVISETMKDEEEEEGICIIKQKRSWIIYIS